MTIKELCEKHEKCKACTFVPVYPYNEYWDIPLNKISNTDSKEITNAIIKTAKILLEDETIKDKLNLMYGNGTNVYVDTDSIKVREEKNYD